TAAAPRAASLEAALLHADRAEHGTGRGPRLGVGKRELGLLVRFLETSLLDEGGRTLEGRLRLGGKGGPGRPTRRTGARQGRGLGSEAASPETRGPPGRGHPALGHPLRHDYHYQ